MKHRMRRGPGKPDPEDSRRVWFQSEKKGFKLNTSHWLDGYPIPDAVGLKAMMGREEDSA